MGAALHYLSIDPPILLDLKVDDGRIGHVRNPADTSEDIFT